jgi:hypothetical protein
MGLVVSGFGAGGEMVVFDAPPPPPHETTCNRKKKLPMNLIIIFI